MTVWDKRWDELGEQNPNSFVVKIYEEYIKKLPQNIKILDLGCGNGADTLFFASKGIKKITALDNSKKALDALKDVKNIKTLNKDIKDVNFQKESFDIVYAHLSLHYFDDIITKKIFKKVISWVKPNGCFFIKCKSTKDRLKNDECVRKDMYKPKNGWVRHLFSKSYMKECLGKDKMLFLEEVNHNYHGYDSFFIEAGIEKGK